MTLLEAKTIETMRSGGLELINSLADVPAEEFESKDREISQRFNPIIDRIYQAANLQKQMKPPQDPDSEEFGDLD